MKLNSGQEKWWSRKPWLLHAPTNLPIQPQFTDKFPLWKIKSQLKGSCTPLKNEKSDSRRTIGSFGIPFTRHSAPEHCHMIRKKHSSSQLNLGSKEVGLHVHCPSVSEGPTQRMHIGVTSPGATQATMDMVASRQHWFIPTPFGTQWVDEKSQLSASPMGKERIDPYM